MTVREATDRRVVSRRRYAAAYARRRRRLQAYGLWSPRVLVDPGQAREHLVALGRFGLSLEAISGICGQSTCVLAGLVYPAHHRFGRRITAGSAASILAVEFDLDALEAGRRIGSAGTVRRLQALAALGWPLSVLAADLGVSPQAVSAFRSRATVTAATARAVRELYRARSMAVGPSPRTAAAAAAAGWVPPLAWDDDELDDPHATPRGCHDDQSASVQVPPEGQPSPGGGVDEVAVARAAAGERLALTGEERRAVALTLARRGLSDPAIAALLSVSARTVLRWRRASATPSRLARGATA